MILPVLNVFSTRAVIQIQRDAGRLSTVLTYKCTLLCCLKCWTTSIFKISFQLNFTQSSSTCIHLKWICFLYLFSFGFSKSCHSKCSFIKSLLLPSLPSESGLLTLPLSHNYALGALLLLNFPVSQTLLLLLLHSNLEHGTLV